MARLVAVAFTLLGLAIAGPTHAADISGVWLTDTADAHIRLAKCGANMCGTIIWLNTAVDILVHRLLKEKSHRPVIKNVSDADLKSFIIKKLQDRKLYYEQADVMLHEESITIDSLLKILPDA